MGIFEFLGRHYFCLKMWVTGEPLSLKGLNKKKSVINSCILIKNQIELVDIYLPVLTPCPSAPVRCTPVAFLGK